MGRKAVVEAPEAPFVPAAAGPETARRTAAPAAAVAARLHAAAPAKPLLYLLGSERRAEELGRALAALAPELQALVLPAWDCLPYDRASPSREVMGRRMAALARCADKAARPRVLVVPAAALIQRLPPAEALAEASWTLAPGDSFDPHAFQVWAERMGYVLDERVDEPGEIALLGEVLDVFPAHLASPVRVRLAEGRVAELSVYDPLTQRSQGVVDRLTLGPASELIRGEGEAAEAGAEHRLPLAYERLRTVFDLLPFAQVCVEPGALDRAAALLEQVEEAHRTQREFAGEAAALKPSALYLTAEELTAGAEGLKRLELSMAAVEPAPRLATARNPGRSFAETVAGHAEAGRRVALTGLPHELRGLRKALKRGLEREAEAAADFAAVLEAPGGAVLTLEADLDQGFTDTEAQLAVLAAADVYGGRVAERRAQDPFCLEPELRVGDVVIHEDHGVGVLRALERVAVDGAERDVLRLEYHGGADLLAPVEEIGRIWRYGAEAEAVTLDRLKGDGWAKRRAEASAAITADAEALVAQARERETARTEPITPPKAPYARFAARFPYPETPDQRDAIAAVLEDLGSGRPMNRLVCGDVGFGKTEVALRAAAAVALSGRQVAIAAPTTVLARQHLQSFERRFAGTGIKVAQLSRLATTGEARAVKAGLAAGEIGVVVGTHALAAKDVAFKDLALMILDEEQKFGAKMKADLRGLAPHLLSLTATPIPRTLQAAMVGVQEVSVIASPPARRRPIRTFLSPFDAATLRTALLREKRRNGQSFLVAPRISDLDGLRAQLETLVPELSVAVAHGELPAEDVDAVMVDFADGRGDVLLATNIIESGLDVPRANTMLVWRADRFGLAQLHQLRGRVGRGRVQGVCYLLTDPEEPLADATRARLMTLEAFDRLGSGLAISQRDLDLRGGGDLVGEQQAGHVKLIGQQLYQRLMRRAVAVARGDAPAAEVSPELQLGEAGALPESYIPDAVIRINLYDRLARLTETAEVDSFEEELEDRFGPPPAEAQALLTAHRLLLLARAARVRRLSAGPAAVAMELAPEAAGRAEALADATAGLEWRNGRLVQAAPEGGDRLQVVAAVLEKLAH